MICFPTHTLWNGGSWTFLSSCFHCDATHASASLLGQRMRFLEHLLCFKGLINAMVLSIPFGTALGEQRLIQPPSIWRNLAWPTGRKFSDDSPGALGAKSAEAMIEAVGFHTPEGAYLISNRIPAPSLKTAIWNATKSNNPRKTLLCNPFNLWKL